MYQTFDKSSFRTENGEDAGVSVALEHPAHSGIGIYFESLRHDLSCNQSQLCSKSRDRAYKLVQ